MKIPFNIIKKNSIRLGVSVRAGKTESACITAILKRWRPPFAKSCSYEVMYAGAYNEFGRDLEIEATYYTEPSEGSVRL